MGVEMVRAAMECVQLFDTKQQDYGSNNISSSGELGIAVRLQDQSESDAAHPPQGAHGAGEVRSRFQGEPRVARGHVQGRGELRAHRAAVAAQTVEIMGQWFLPMGVRLRISRLPLFFRNSEKHEFTWKTT